MKIGIDISYCNHTYSTIDFKAVKNEVNFVMIRAGYRGYIDGALRKDKFFEQNINGCIGFNIPFGVYFFSQAVNESEGREEAKFVLNLIEGLKLDYPIAIDTELSGHANNRGRADNITPMDRTEAVKGFCDEIEKAGYFAQIYCSESWYKTQLIPNDLKAYDFWIANWTKKPSVECGMWQYSEKGQVNGIKGNTDMNYAYKDYPSIMKENGLNGYGNDETVYEVHIYGLTGDEFDDICEFLKERDIPHDDKIVKG